MTDLIVRLFQPKALQMKTHANQEPHLDSARNPPPSTRLKDTKAHYEITKADFLPKMALAAFHQKLMV
jgi:hypothetical protein